MVAIDTGKIEAFEWYLARGDSIKKAVTDSKGNVVCYASYNDALKDRKPGDLILKREVCYPCKSTVLS